MLRSCERRIAWRLMFSERGRGGMSLVTFVSLLGIILGVATLLVVVSVMDGFQQALVQRVIVLNGDMSVLYGEEDIALSSRLSEIPGIEQALPYIDAQGLAVKGRKSAGLFIRGFHEHDLAHHPIFPKPAFFDENSIILGYRAAEQLGLKIGDSLGLMVSNIKDKEQPELKVFTLAATFKAGFYQFDSSYAVISYVRAEEIFSSQTRNQGIEIRLHNPVDSEQIRRIIWTEIDSNVRIQDWREANTGFLRLIETQKSILFLVLTVIVIVASLNIVSGLIMLSGDRRADIAILRTMGLSRAGIIRIFLFIGAMIGFLGTSLGLILGAFFAYNIDTIKQWLEGFLNIELFNAEVYMVSELPAKIEISSLLAIAFMAFGLCLLAAVLPAWRSAQIEPGRGVRRV